MIRRLRLRCLVLAAVLACALAACAPAGKPQLRVLATDPGAEAILGAQQRFYIRFALDTDRPLTVTVEPWFGGEPLSVNLGTSAPAALPAGGGSAVASVFFWGEHATRVDQLRLIARAPKETQPRAELVLPVKLAWVGRELPPRAPPAWLQETAAPASPAAALDARSQWLVFGGVLAGVAVAGFLTRWLRARRRKTPPSD